MMLKDQVALVTGAGQGIGAASAKALAEAGAFVVAVAHSILIASYHILKEEVPYQDLGGDYFLRRDNPEHRRRRAIDQLERLGYRVTLQPAA